MITCSDVGCKGNAEPPRGVAVKSASVFVARRILDGHQKLKCMNLAIR